MFGDLGQSWERFGFERRGFKKRDSVINWPLLGGKLKKRVLWLITEQKCGSECSNCDPESS